jgi:hypothetical protein
MDAKTEAKEIAHTRSEGEGRRAGIPSNRLHGMQTTLGDKRLASFLCTPPDEPLVGMLRLILSPTGTAGKDSPTAGDVSLDNQDDVGVCPEEHEGLFIVHGRKSHTK